MPFQDLWYKNAIIYSLDIESFQDGNGDGVGDFQGLTRRLGYLAGLGVTCVWLHPFFPSPRRDNGYDVADYYQVDPRFGTLGDFVEFTHQASIFGIRVIIDLVVNHTSDQHPWFQAARSDPNSKHRNYYVWSESAPEGHKQGIVFPGYQQATWTYDKKARLWYHHRFYDFQPDLNFANPEIHEEIRKVAGFWLELGVSGFRVDAVPFLLELEPAEQSHGLMDYEYLDSFRQFLNWRARDAIVMGEANVPLESLPKYFGDGDRMQMVLNFIANQHLFNSLAQEDATPLVRALETLPPLPRTAQWGTFLRNHDEIDLGRLTEAERKVAFQAFGPDPSMQLYDRGIRRRLAPMLDNDAARLELAYSMLFTLPGTPVLRYGDEIGMGDDLSLPQRSSIRTPMQWSDEPNAGFSDAPADRLVMPVISEGDFGYENVNVETQRHDPLSLLNRVERMIRVRKEHPEFGLGERSVIDVGEASIFACRAAWEGTTTVAVHNLSRKPCRFSMDLAPERVTKLTDALRGDTFMPNKEGKFDLTLEGSAFRWLQVTVHK